MVLIGPIDEPGTWVNLGVNWGKVHVTKPKNPPATRQDGSNHTWKNRQNQSQTARAVRGDPRHQPAGPREKRPQGGWEVGKESWLDDIAGVVGVVHELFESRFVLRRAEIREDSNQGVQPRATHSNFCPDFVRTKSN